MVTRLSDEDRTRIGDAVRAAEQATDGEIVAIAAACSDKYRDAVLHWALLGMLLTLAVQAVVPNHFIPVLDRATGSGWGRDWTLGELLAAQLLLLSVVFLVLRFALAGARYALTPGATKSRRVRARAVLLFRASIEARTATRTGVLLYLSLAERRAEIVTDAEVLNRVPHEAWGVAMADLTDAIRDGRAGDGMVAAIGRIGAILAEHFPFSGTDPNELPDRLIEL